MSAWGSFGPGTRILILALGGGVVAGAGLLVWQATRPVEEAAEVTTASVDPAPAKVPEVVAEAPTAEDAAPAPDPVPLLPKIDTWRIAPDGEALVAGKALPGASVAVIVNDRSVAEGVALASGEFVLQFTLPPNPAPSLLWLSMTTSVGAPVVSPEMVAVAPIAGPKPAVAATETPEETATEEPLANLDEATPEAGADVETIAEAAPSALLVTEEGAVVLQDAAPPDPALVDQVLIDTIAYAPTGAVLVGGRGTAGAALRLYLDNAEVAVAAVAEDGSWLVTLGDSAPGIYTLRVDQIDTAGKVTSRFETPFKRETVEALALAAGTSTVPESEGVTAPDAAPSEATVAAEAAPAAPGAQSETAIAATTDPTVVPEPAPETAAALPATDDTAATETASEPVALAEAAPPPPVTITVQPGFTLWGIAQERLGDGVLYVQVFEANRDRIKNPDLIYPGQVFSIPEGLAP
jgi:nucleoid-associated protein YgaU